MDHQVNHLSRPSSFSADKQFEYSSSIDKVINHENKLSSLDETAELPVNKAKRRKVAATNQLQFHLNKDDILELAEDCLDPELVSLGVTSFNQNTYEQGVINQLEKAITVIDDTRDVEKTDSKLNTKIIISDNGDNYLEEDDVDSCEELDDPNDKDYIVEYEEELEDTEEATNGYIEPCLDDDVDKFEEAPLSCFEPRKKKCLNFKLGLDKINEKIEKHILDDGDEGTFKKRLAEYRLHQAELNIVDSDEKYYQICDELRIPSRIWDRLFKHQQESLRWLWGLHVNLCGGIVGDEMGLGKTIQVIAYFVALRCSKYREVGHVYQSLGPVLLVCPATVMHQWVQEFHSWWPQFRVAILHNTGTYSGPKRSLIREIFRASGVLITTYNGMCTYSKELTEYSWHYVILDEGHKIRNPEATVTHCCKLLKTPHRLVLSGSPIQNNLQELWSLFDFIYPGKLGTLTNFMNTVAHPIRRGGYCNASHFDIQVSYKCTLMLRDSIKPYLLRRTKEDVKVALCLPEKNEQVLFCKLTDQQRNLYQSYIDSGVIRDIHQGHAQVFAALVKIRKICNHPYLFWPLDRETPEFDAQFFLQSGKMGVVNALLKLWSKQEHKVLLFTQSCQMLDLLERFMQMKHYKYLRMDGQTSISMRQGMIKEFNTNPELFIFLLTTKVGGIGVNLIGADRVIIYDPDWNPCTDIQARERCWRIGQNRNVIIYRLLTAGTVEEKIYHRQIYKQYLTNSILKNANHRRFFKINNLRELFTLNDINQTSLMFEDSKVNFTSQDVMPSSKGNSKLNKKKQFESNNEIKDKLPKIPKKHSKINCEPIKVEISEQRRQELMENAKRLSRMVSLKFSNANGNDQNGLTQSLAENDNKVVISTEKKEKKKKKDRHTKEGIKFEGKRIKYLMAQEEFEQNEKRKQKKKDKLTSGKDRTNKEDYILQNLLGNSLDVVLQHDTIENVNVPDHYHLEREAEKVAKEAIEGLRNSNNASYVNGNIDFLNPNRPQVGPVVLSAQSSQFSSANMIATIKARQENNSKGNGHFSGDVSKGTSDVGNNKFLENNDLMLQLRDFVHHKAARPGEATSDEILTHFEGRLAPEKCSIFKSMLRNLCDKTGHHKHVVWKLKPEFQNNS